ncbi:hypothetical protein HCA61_03735 [Rhodococcus sp. HNM0563]|uniref:hypothetical protein n=1 Tax=Rhodococcus sp. HNM0563 TaxID=2716339 RepID=UPI00146DBBD1|nr:hypothetical protein [Rhodococcus sp. HNM0563]NLU61372.1 hypothetical protein [Rhodococcus sp. HNM0563]
MGTSVDLKIVRSVDVCSYTWVWVGLHQDIAVAFLSANRTSAEEDWDEHATISYLYSKLKGYKIGRELLRRAQSDLLRDNLVLFRSGVATPHGRDAVADFDLDISPRVKRQRLNAEHRLQRWNRMQPSARGERPRAIQEDLDAAKAETDGARILDQLAVALGYVTK